ncbi:hypothetical protein QWM81_26005 [Streptomyces ficellus]|uniref:PE domain-containing protein n=1 Tax=Streptomyces ficellus TaxID=1977088 RepID=A0ABT7ZD43_9ACTN|nr:hypothetical protein [Streptomyces ficellus]MDN3297433.1 hypothetical protein [Streptomyces ficellus]
MASDLERGVGALRRFQQRVNTLLTELENGAAGKTKVSAQTISPASLTNGGSKEFPEAHALYTQYHRVHQSLVSLSQSLGDQIEMLTIAVHAADVGFDNVDEDVRRRFAEIKARVDQRHAAEEAREKPTDKPQAPSSHDHSSDGGVYR